MVLTVGIFKRQQPSPAYAADEQQRADGLADRIKQIKSNPDNPSNNSLHHYQDAYRDASQNAAAHAEQPKRGWRS